MAVEVEKLTDGKLTWNFELNVVKEYLSKFYTSDFACLREFVANAIAAQMRCNIKVPVHVEIHPDRIIIEDRGVGISREKFEEIFMWFGRSENREVEGIQGMFGLGAKSFMMFTGTEGKMVMKTRSRETEETYTAILTSTHAEIVGKEGKEDYGTRFEIYFERVLNPASDKDKAKVIEYVNRLGEKFNFSRIPVEIKASFGEYNFEGTVGVENHEIEVIEENNVYLLGVLKTEPHKKRDSYKKDKTAIVVGDTLADISTYYSPPGFYLHIKVEDGREVDVMGCRVKTPVPLPNRDGYKEGYSSFVKLMELKYKIELFKKDYSKFLNMSPLDLSSYGTTFLNQLNDRVKEIVGKKGWYSSRISEEEEEIVEKELPGFHTLEKNLKHLLTKLPAYGAWGYLNSNGRRERVTVADMIHNKRAGYNVGYLTRRPSSKKEIDLDENSIYAAFVESSDTVRFLEENGVKKVKVRSKKRFKVYNVYTRVDNVRCEYMTFEGLLENWNGEIILYAEKVNDLLHKWLPRCWVIVGPKSTYNKLKSTFGDFVMTYDEFLEFVDETTLVTDGYTVKTLKQVRNENSEEIQLDDMHINSMSLLPLIRKVAGMNVYGILGLNDSSLVLGTYGKLDVDAWCNSFKNGEPAADLLYLIFKERDLLSRSEAIDGLVSLAYKYAGVQRSKDIKELEEFARPLFRQVLKKYATLSLKRYEYRGSGKNIVVEGLRLRNPLIPIDNCGDIARLAELQYKFGIFGAIIYYAEVGYSHSGSFTQEQAIQFVREELRIRDLSEDEWRALVKNAPNTVKRIAVAALI